LSAVSNYRATLLYVFRLLCRTTIRAQAGHEFRARRVEEEAAVRTRPVSPLWSGLVGLLIVASIGVDYAFTLKGSVGLSILLIMIAVLAVVGVMAVRAVRRAERQRTRAIELDRLQSLWEERLDLRSPTL
jgi:hypothetical protein